MNSINGLEGISLLKCYNFIRRRSSGSNRIDRFSGNPQQNIDKKLSAQFCCVDKKLPGKKESEFAGLRSAGFDSLGSDIVDSLRWGTVITFARVMGRSLASSKMFVSSWLVLEVGLAFTLHDSLKSFAIFGA